MAGGGDGQQPLSPGAQWIPVGSDLGDLGKTALLDPVGYDLVIFSVYFPIYWTYWNIGNISGIILIILSVYFPIWLWINTYKNTIC